jgi:hypothetical protein
MRDEYGNWAVSCTNTFEVVDAFCFLNTWAHCIVKFFPFVEPHFRDASSIFEHNIRDTSGECVRAFISEHMSNMTARSNFQNSATLPNLFYLSQQFSILKFFKELTK